MPWLRLWIDILDDSDLVELPESTCWAWALMLACAKKFDQDGALPDLKRLALWMRKPRASVETWLNELVAAGLLERDGVTVRIHGWSRWQEPKDKKAAERMRRWRKRHSPSALPKTDTDTDTEGERVQRNASLLRRNTPVTTHPPVQILTPEPQAPTKVMPPDWVEVGRQAEEQCGDVSWAMWVREQWIGGFEISVVAHAINRCLEKGILKRSYANKILTEESNERAKQANGKAG